MKINLNIIKIWIVTFLVISGLPKIAYSFSWQGTCLYPCTGCLTIALRINNVANNIDNEHDDLEDAIAEKYKKDILKANIKLIDEIQVGITKSVARINAMEHEANIDSKKLIFLLRKNKDLYTLPQGSR